MTTCEQVQPALLDEAAPRPVGLEEHLASCPACRAFAAAHRGALRLRGAELVRTHRRPLVEVQRRAGILAGLALVLGGGVGWYQLEFGTRPRVQERPMVLELAPPALAPQAEEDGLLALAELQSSLSADLARDPRDDAAAVRAFGALPRWTAPRRTQPMRSLGRAASPVVFTSEDSP